MEKFTFFRRNRTCLSVLLLAVMTQQLQAEDKAAPSDIRARASKEAMEMSEHVRNQYLEANHLLADINLAELALELGMKDKAKMELEDAHKVATKLAESTPVFRSTESLKLGKMSYKTEQERKVYYVPLYNDVFIERDYRPVFSSIGKPRLEEDDVRVANVSVSINLKDVQSAISQAQSEINKDDLKSAIQTLNKTMNATVISEVSMEAPSLAVYDNLALARNLSLHGNYQSARLALRTAKTELEKFQKEGSLTTGAAETVKLEKDIEKFQVELEAKDPSLLKRIENEISSWMNIVEKW